MGSALLRCAREICARLPVNHKGTSGFVVKPSLTLYQLPFLHPMAPRNGKRGANATPRRDPVDKAARDPSRDATFLVFDLARQSLIAMGDTIPERPFRPQTVAAWLDRFYGAWVRGGHRGLSLMLTMRAELRRDTG
jgi:hypothetical protein